MRRSKSVSDMRDISSFHPSLKRTQPTLAPIPNKTTRMAPKPLMSTKSLDNFKKPAIVSRTLPNSSSNKRNAAGTSKTATTTKNAATTAAKAPAETTTATSADVDGKMPPKKKFAPYDFKGKFHDLLERHNILKERLAKNQEAMGHLETLPDLYDESQNQLFSTKEELKNSKVEVECLQRECKSQEVKISSITKCLQKTKEELDSLLETYQVIFCNFF